MTEKEKCTDEALKNCIQEAYGLSDEQLLAELEELEASLSDDEFVGAEDRIYNKIKERENERSSEPSEMVVPSEAPASSPISIRKISKKKKLLVVGIAAVLAVGAGVNAIGGNNYFLRRDESKESIVLDSGQNVIKVGDLQDAYEEVENQLNFDVLRMNYFPSGMVFNKVSILNNRATFEFNYSDKIIYFIQEREEKGLSIGIKSDRKNNSKTIFNEWISKEILIEENTLDNGTKEYSAVLSIEDINYRLIGIISREELEKIVCKLSFN